MQGINLTANILISVLMSATRLYYTRGLQSKIAIRKADIHLLREAARWQLPQSRRQSKIMQRMMSNVCLFPEMLINTINFHIQTVLNEIVYILAPSFEGYLYYKTIASQNVPSDEQVKNFFLLQKSYVPFLRHSSFCNFNNLMIYHICDIMMSIST